MLRSLTDEHVLRALMLHRRLTRAELATEIGISKPTAGEVTHYRWWLEKELDLVKPTLVVALGATAALALAGKPLAVSKNRGPIILDGRPGFITIHPSFLLRMPEEDKARSYKDFVADMRHINRLVNRQKAA